VAIGEQRRVGRELLADWPGAGSGDDDARGVGNDNGIQIAPHSRGAELIVQSDERIGATAAAAVVHGVFPARSLPRRNRPGQEECASVGGWRRPCPAHHRRRDFSTVLGARRDDGRSRDARGTLEVHRDLLVEGGTCETVRCVHLVVPPGGSFRETRRIELGARVLTIGRAETCDVRVDVPGVDDEHAKISEVALIAVGPDCAVGDVPLEAGQRRLVMPGDEVQIGSVVLALDGNDPSQVDQTRRGPRIRVVEGQNFGDELLLADENREYVIGRSPKADLVLEDREVSREHIKIVRRGYSVFIYDAASTRGSWLGRSAVYQGTRVEWQRPRMLKLGATVLSLDLPEEARARAPAVQVSAPMTPPPRGRVADKAKPVANVPVADAGPLTNVPVYHYEAKSQPASSSPPPPSSRPMDLTASGPRSVPPAPHDMTPIAPSIPPPSSRHGTGARTAWKKTGPTIGRASGLLLLALAGIAILGVLFVVFSLME
jgi:pSer/pThr/pTyr-binding forkhead associated (FHA) protein